jgi:hypothetical protein
VPKGRPLKVYWAEIDGLHDWVVAAPNRDEALKAFGVRQDLFAQGEAGDASDPDAAKAARAAPLTPLRRPKGSSEPFAPATGAADWSAALAEARPKAAPGRSKTKAAAEAPPPKPKPDRRPLDRAEAELAAIESRHRDALERLVEDRARLDQREAREKADYEAAVAAAKRDLGEARKAWREAGGD